MEALRSESNKYAYIIVLYLTELDLTANFMRGIKKRQGDQDVRRFSRLLYFTTPFQGLTLFCDAYRAIWLKKKRFWLAFGRSSFEFRMAYRQN
jgi:hypothetical protein